MGKLIEDGRIVVFLTQGDRNLIVRLGDTIDGTYRVDAVTEQHLSLTYLPLKQKQDFASEARNEIMQRDRVRAVRAARRMQHHPAVDDGKKLIAEGRTEEGLAKLQQAARDNPNNAQALSTYVGAREAYVIELVRQADAARLFGTSPRPRCSTSRRCESTRAA